MIIMDSKKLVEINMYQFDGTNLSEDYSPDILVDEGLEHNEDGIWITDDVNGYIEYAYDCVNSESEFEDDDYEEAHDVEWVLHVYEWGRVPGAHCHWGKNPYDHYRHWLDFSPAEKITDKTIAACVPFDGFDPYNPDDLAGVLQELNIWDDNYSHWLSEALYYQPQFCRAFINDLYKRGIFDACWNNEFRSNLYEAELDPNILMVDSFWYPTEEDRIRYDFNPYVDMKQAMRDVEEYMNKIPVFDVDQGRELLREQVEPEDAIRMLAAYDACIEERRNNGVDWYVCGDAYDGGAAYWYNEGWNTSNAKKAITDFNLTDFEYEELYNMLEEYEKTIPSIILVNQTTDEYEGTFYAYNLVSCGQVIGSATVKEDDDKAYLTSIDIDDGFRNNGYGTIVTRTLSEMFDGLYVAPDNEDANRLFWRIGWGIPWEKAAHLDQGYGVYYIKC